MGAYRKLRRGLDLLLEGVVAIVMGVLVIDVTWQVFTRYVLNNASSWTEELATYLMIWVGLLGASVALRRGAHLGIDYFVSHLSPRARASTEVFVFLAIAAFSVAVLIVGGANLVNETLARGQASPAVGVPMGYVYLALPISGFFLTLYSMEFLIERLAIATGRRPPEDKTASPDP